jgi:hypothetical protein
MADIDRDIETTPAVFGNRSVHRSVHRLDQRFQIRPLIARAQSYAGAKALGQCAFLEGIDTEVHPNTIEHVLDCRDNARLTRSRRAI